MVLRLFGGLEKKHEIGPLTKEEIAKLPTVYYIPAPPEAKEKISSPTSASGSDKPTEARRDHASMPSETSAIGSDGSGKANENDKTATKPKRRRHLLRILFKPRRSTSKDSNDLSKAEAGNLSNGPYVPTKYPLHPLPDNLSSCPICLSDYEAPPLLTASAEERDKALEELEPLTLLPCSHSIHKDCLAPWLQTSGRCPVCQRAVLGEKEGKQKKSRLRLRRRRHNRTQRQSQSQEDTLETPTAASVSNATATTPSRDSAAPISAVGALPPPAS